MAKYHFVTIGDQDELPKNLPYIGEDYSFKLIQHSSVNDIEKDTRALQKIKTHLVDHVQAKFGEYIIYIDSSMLFNFKPFENLWYDLISPLEFTNSDLLIKAHPKWRSYREDGEACITTDKWNSERISTQLNQYRLMNILESSGHPETTFFAFQVGNLRMNQFFYQWHKFIIAGSLEDQLSFAAACTLVPLRICWVSDRSIKELASQCPK